MRAGAMIDRSLLLLALGALLLGAARTPTASQWLDGYVNAMVY